MRKSLRRRVGGKDRASFLATAAQTKELQGVVAERALRWIIAQKPAQWITEARPRTVDTAAYVTEQDFWRTWKESISNRRLSSTRRAQPPVEPR